MINGCKSKILFRSGIIGLMVCLLFISPVYAWTPATPTGLIQTVVNPTNVCLEWSYSDFASIDGFEIYRAAGDSLTWTCIGFAPVPFYSFADLGVTPNTDYYYAIKAFKNDAGISLRSDYSNQVTVHTPVGVPAAPSNLAVSGSGTSATLTWDDNSSDELRFVICRQVGSGPWIVWGEVATNARTFTDNGLTIGEGYSYRVYAANTAEMSGFSNTVTYTPPAAAPSLPAAPTNLVISGLGTSATLSWDDNSSNETRFVIERQVGSDPWATRGEVTPNTRTFADSALTPGVTYSYRIYADNSGTNSSYSNVAAYTPSASIPSGPAPRTVTMQFFIGSTYYYTNGMLHTMDAPATILEGRTLLPITYAAQPLGAVVNWQPASQQVNIALNSTRLELWINQNSARLNGALVSIDPGNPAVVPIVIPPGRTMLPLSFIAQNLGCRVSWNAATREVTITYPGP